MKLTKNEKIAFAWIAEHGSLRGFTFGRGRPYDRQMVQRLIDKHAIYPYGNHPCRAIELCDYAVIGQEDEYGFAPYTNHGDVVWAAYLGSPVVVTGYREDDPEFNRLLNDARQNGHDTAWEKYPDANHPMYDYAQEHFTTSTHAMLMDA